MPGSVLSVNLAEIRTIRWRGKDVRTGIWKRPVEGRVAARGVNLEGDEQADRKVHGGPHKAVYAYAREDIDWWEQELGRKLGNGALGENLTLRGVDVSGAYVGERWRIGSVLLEVSEPRLPCFKLGVRMEDRRFVRWFAQALRTGAYLRIVEEGELGAGDLVAIADRPSEGLPVQELARIYLHDKASAGRLLEVSGLSESWRDWARSRAA